MIVLARAVTRLITFLLLLSLALIGLAVAATAVAPAKATDVMQLPQLRDTTGRFLEVIAAGGPVAVASGLAGVGAVLLGLLLLLGLLVPRRERLVRLASAKGGTISARRRPLAHAAETLVEQVRGVAAAKVKVRPRRTSGGRLRVRVDRPRTADAKQTCKAVTEELQQLTGPFKLRSRVETRAGEHESRVQ